MTTIEKANVPITVQAGVSVSSGVAFPMSEHDGKILFIAKNTSTTAAASLTVQAGDGLQAIEDLEMAIPASGEICFCLESGKFKKLYGTNKGSAYMSGTGITVSEYILP